MSESKNSGKTGHRFGKGNRYGKGRPEGSRNKATIALQALLDAEGEEITRKAIELAKTGDTTALRLVIERLIPPVKERKFSLALPKVETPAGVTTAIGAVLAAVAAGEIAPGEAQAIAGLLEAQRRSLERLELEKRIEAIEQAQAGGQKR